MQGPDNFHCCHWLFTASLPPNMGDSILASLSLPPSGRVPSKQSAGAKRSAADPSHDTQTRDETPFITPVIGTISNEDVPFMISTNKRTLRDDDATKENLKFTVVKERENSEDDGVKEGGEQMEEERNAPRRRSGMKRKQHDKRESDEDAEVFSTIRSGGKRTSKSLRDASRLRQGIGDQRTNESEEDGAKMVRNKECNGAVLETCMNQLGVESLCLPEDPSLCSIFVSCLCRQPRVLLNRLSLTSASANRGGRGGKSSHTKRQDRRRKSPVKAPTHKSASNQRQKPDADFPGLDDKE